MFLLDTNTISHWIKAPNAKLLGHFSRVPLSDLAVSPIVEAELRCSLARKGIAKSKVGVLVDRFLSAVQILSWESSTARCFAQLRTDAEARGITVDTVDLMIASHAKEDATFTLVTTDGALLRLTPWIKVVDWTK